MGHVLITTIIALFAGLTTFFAGGRAIQIKAMGITTDTKSAKFLIESKQSAFSLLAGFSLFLPALYGVTEQPKYIALVTGALVWCVIAIASAIHWYKKYPEVFRKSQ
jgi:uncharacterized membrane protein (GlpM family)